MNRFESIALIEDVLVRSMICREAVFPAAIGGHRVEVEIQRQRTEIAINIYTVIFEPEAFMQMTRRSQSGPRVVDM
jgi:hypothetical protein